MSGGPLPAGSGNGRPLPTPSEILAGWGERWAQVTETDETAVRVRAATIVVVISGFLASVRGALKTLSAHHPGRFIVVALDGSDEEASLELLGPHDSASPNSELVFLPRTDEAAAHWTEVVWPLVLPELPVYLWVPSPRVATRADVAAALAAVDHVVMDSADAAPPWVLWESLREERSQLGLMDLNCTRIAPWRPMVAEAFDAPEALQLLPTLTAMEGSGRRQGESGALWLWAWIASPLEIEKGVGCDLVSGRRPSHFGTVPALLAKDSTNGPCGLRAARRFSPLATPICWRCGSPPPTGAPCTSTRSTRRRMTRNDCWPACSRRGSTPYG